MSDPIRDAIFEKDLYAWVGDDELGNGGLGLKQGFIPDIARHGLLALVSFVQRKLVATDLMEMNQKTADTYGKARYLVRYKAAEIVGMVSPAEKG